MRSKRNLLKVLGWIFVIACVSECWKHFTVRQKSARNILVEVDTSTTRSKTYIILDYNGYGMYEKEDYYVYNCLITRNVTRIHQTHAVAVTSRFLQRMGDLPKVRYPWQRWIWVMDESPYHGVMEQPFTLADFDHVYNWTMTYRSDSDVCIPHGRTFPKNFTHTRNPLPAYIGNRMGIVVAVISNCGICVHNHRMEYLKKFNETLEVTLYGKCGSKLCPGYAQDIGLVLESCAEIRKYLFYFAFENSNCREYITDKLFANGFHTGAVPIVMGAPKEDYAKIAPPNSFIHTGDFASPKKMAKYLKYLSENMDEYMKFHEWRKYYETSKRNQYIDRSVWEPLCAKLNTDTGEPKSVPSLADFWSVEKDCDDTEHW